MGSGAPPLVQDLNVRQQLMPQQLQRLHAAEGTDMELKTQGMSLSSATYPPQALQQPPPPLWQALSQDLPNDKRGATATAAVNMDPSVSVDRVVNSANNVGQRTTTATQNTEFEEF